MGASLCGRVLEKIFPVLVASCCGPPGTARSMNVAYRVEMEQWERVERV
jgi:hypothetical protein